MIGSSEGTITRPYTHAALGSREWQESVLVYVCPCFVQGHTHACADITLAHISRSEMTKRRSEFTFTYASFFTSTRFERTSSEGTITRPYAHASLKPGKPNVVGTVPKCDLTLDCISFLENAVETQKSIRTLRLASAAGADRRHAPSGMAQHALFAHM